MKSWMATTAALALLAGVSTVTAQSAQASNDNAVKTMERSTKSSHQTRVHQSMRMRHHARETTGFGGRTGAIGSGRNDPSIHQSAGDRDSRDFPKQH